MATYPPPVENLPIFNSLLFTETQGTSSSSSSTTTPTGVITAFFGATAPVGWLMCNGSQFSSTEYVALYNLLNSNYTPDLRGTFLRGSGTNGTYLNWEGQALTGQAVGSYVVDNLASHNHSYSANSDTIQFQLGTVGSGVGIYNRLQYIVFNGTTYSATDGGSNSVTTSPQTLYTGLNNTSNPNVVETYPCNYAINYIIKT
jgi:microcystin-dependent protein